MKKGKLYLIPSFLGESPSESVFPPVNAQIIKGISHFIVEELRTARRFLKKVCPEIEIDSLTFYLYNEHTVKTGSETFLEPLLNGHDTGIISEAGTPCVADPGSEIVRMAHAAGIQVVPLVGPSSLLLALMASGFNGQQFAFHGYLPIDKPARAKRIREIEQTMKLNNQTQIFIETPYRNQQLLQSILETCNESTLLCVAVSLTEPGESIITRSVKEWKKIKNDINKKPAVFLMYF
ncbi:MAG: SAM-dependent methyltransferase [Bacteroidetes bacterium]|nr:SAM-dependent methyltransferase [Bacteroidota bacterium]